MTVLSVDNLSIQLAGRSVLSRVRLYVTGGEMVGLLGPNGAGKTTLIKALAGLLSGNGTVCLDGQPLRNLTFLERARRIAYLPQGGEIHWPVRVRDIVALGRLPHGKAWSRRRYGHFHTRDDKVNDLAVKAALHATETESLAERSLTALSGGERARVLLARALAVEASVLLADEPVAHLDPGHQLQVLALLRRQVKVNTAVVVVLHDLALAARFCDRVVVLAQGCTVAAGPPAEVLDDGLIARVYGIRVVRGECQGTPFLLPWEPVTFSKPASLPSFFLPQGSPASQEYKY